MSDRTALTCSTLLLVGLLAVAGAVVHATLSRPRFIAVQSGSGVYLIDPQTGEVWDKSRARQEQLGSVESPKFPLRERMAESEKETAKR